MQIGPVIDVNIFQPARLIDPEEQPRSMTIPMLIDTSYAD